MSGKDNGGGTQMKLVEILARELDKWPNYANAATQDPDKEVRFDNPSYDFFATQLADDAGEDYGCGEEVTRADWEAERARIKGESKAAKANKDGWIRHRGGNQPVHDDDRVEYRMRSGRIFKAPAGELDWSHNNHETDIMAWKLDRPEQQIEPAVVANVDAFNARAEMPAAKQDGPMQWRDRVQEINRQMADLRAEKASLIIKLSEEWFALIGEQPF